MRKGTKRGGGPVGRLPPLTAERPRCRHAHRLEPTRAADDLSS